MDATTACTRCETPLEPGDLRCSICGQATPAREPVAHQTKVQQLRCAGCGAALGYDPAVQAPRCAFCGEVLHIETMDDPPERIDAYLPFTVGGDAARASLAAVHVELTRVGIQISYATLRRFAIEECGWRVRPSAPRKAA